MKYTQLIANQAKVMLAGYNFNRYFQIVRLLQSLNREGNSDGITESIACLF